MGKFEPLYLLPTEWEPPLPDEMEWTPECDDSLGPGNEPRYDGPIYE